MTDEQQTDLRALKSQPSRWLMALVMGGITISACQQTTLVGFSESDGGAGSFEGDGGVGVIRSALLTAPVLASHDTALREQTGMIYANDGTGVKLGVSNAAGARQRAIVRFDTAAISAVVAGQQVYAAYLDMNISTLSAGWGGGRVALHRMTKSWVQGTGTGGLPGSSGPSWVCSNDTDTSVFGNATNNCLAGNAWGMEAGMASPVPYAATPTDSAPLYSNGMLTVRFDVTADVKKFLAGTANNGWMMRPLGGTGTGALVEFTSKESLTAPRLILDVGADLCAADATKTSPGQCGCGIADTDTDGDRIADCLEPTLLPVGDTTLRSALPNGNDGLGASLGVTSASVVQLERTLIRFDQTQLVNAAKALEVRSAKLQLTVAGISVGWGGGPIEAFRMTRAWNEGNGTDTVLGAQGPSWNCDNDTNTANATLDCAPPRPWNMITGALPFAATATASASISTGGPTTVTLDVTADVQKFLAGTQPNNGWILKGTTAALSGAWVNFAARETMTPPKLVLTLSESVPPPSSFPAPKGMPDASCTQYRNANTNYFVCNARRAYEVAQHNCERVGMRLAAIDSAAEDTWLSSVMTQATWIGAQETSTAGTWAWDRTGKKFWTGSGAVSGQYSKWTTGEPAGGAPGKCAMRATGATTKWVTDECAQYKAYVCEGSAPATKLDELGTYTSLVTQYVMCRVGQGQATSDLEKSVRDQIAHDAGPRNAAVLAYLAAKCADFDAICTNVNTRLMLASVADYDPCNMTGPLSKDDVRGAVSLLSSTSSRLRDNQCAQSDRHVTVRHRQLAEIAPDNTGGQTQSAAAPWIVGIDPVRQDRNAYFGDYALTTDWNTERSSPSNGSDTGDGLSPFGVKSLDSLRAFISCSACDPAQGQICGGSLGSGYDSAICYSFPVVTRGQELRLHGYNFWDTKGARIGLERFGSPQHRTIIDDVTVVAGSDCRRPSEPTRPFKEGIVTDQAIGAVRVDAGYFYQVRIFNKNGNYSTSFDDPGTDPTADAPRTIHTCWSACNSASAQCPATCANATSTHCAITNCTPPSATQTCTADSFLPTGGCTSAWSVAPRELSTVDAFGQQLCQHSEWDPPTCAETPFWYGNDPVHDRALVYVQAAPPMYQFSTALDVVKCREESGWSWPGEDEFGARLVGFPLDEQVITELIENPASQIPDAFSAEYDGNYDEGERQPGSATSNMPTSPAYRSLNKLLTNTRVGPGGTVIYRLSMLEDDADLATVHDIITGTLKIVGIVVASVDLVGGCGGYCALAGGATAAAAVALEAALAPYESDDDLGKTAWSTDSNQFVQHIVDSHLETFSSTAPLPAVKLDDNGDGTLDTVWGTGSLTATVLHPMDYTNRYLDNPTLCSCASSSLCINDTQATCHSTNGACYAGRCIGGDPYLAASPAAFTPTCDSGGAGNDPTCRKAFRQRIDIKRGGESSRYALDFKLKLQVQNASTGAFDVNPF